jgi:hypothetical protein
MAQTARAMLVAIQSVIRAAANWRLRTDFVSKLALHLKVQPKLKGSSSYILKGNGKKREYRKKHSMKVHQKSSENTGRVQNPAGRYPRDRIETGSPIKSHPVKKKNIP